MKTNFQAKCLKMEKENALTEIKAESFKIYYACIHQYSIRV